MNIYECEKLAQEKGFDSMEFLCHLPVGWVNCKWLDAHMGLIRVDFDGLRDGFITTRDLVSIDPNAVCIPLEGSTDSFKGE
jgi:hypothetical protein